MIVKDNDRVKIIIKNEYVEKIFKQESIGSITEINILSTILHPNIIRLLKISKNDYDYLSIRIEKEQMTLVDWLTKSTYNHLRTEKSKISIIYQIINGVDFLHKNNILHLDLKPDNIMISYINDEPHVKIIDFDNARYMTNHMVLTDITIGTITHRAPECDVGEISVLTKATDIWSIGVLMYEILCGTPLYLHKSLPNCGTVSLDDYESAVYTYVHSDIHMRNLTRTLPDKTTQCFSIDPNNRLKLSELIDILDDYYNCKLKYDNHIKIIEPINNFTQINFISPNSIYYHHTLDKIKKIFPHEFKYYPGDVILATYSAMTRTKSKKPETYLDHLIYIIHTIIPNAGCVNINKIINEENIDRKIISDVIMDLSGIIYLQKIDN